jgi:hypothetical protein
MSEVTASSGLKVKSPRFKVKVGQKHIDESLTKSSSHCMTAEAIKDAIPEARYVSVDISTVRFTDIKKGLRYTYLTPRVCQIAILDYDRGAKIYPFGFELRTAMITQSAVGSTWAASKERNRNALRKRNLLGAKKMSDEASEGTGRIPHIVGGKPPPRMGTRRQHGIRAYETSLQRLK